MDPKYAYFRLDCPLDFFDRILSEIGSVPIGKHPAFRKAVVSIGVHSDIRLRPKLICKYNSCFNKIPLFLKGILEKEKKAIFK